MVNYVVEVPYVPQPLIPIVLSDCTKYLDRGPTLKANLVTMLENPHRLYGLSTSTTDGHFEAKEPIFEWQDVEGRPYDKLLTHWILKRRAMPEEGQNLHVVDMLFIEPVSADVSRHAVAQAFLCTEMVIGTYVGHESTYHNQAPATDAIISARFRCKTFVGPDIDSYASLVLAHYREFQSANAFSSMQTKVEDARHALADVTTNYAYRELTRTPGTHQL